MDRNVAGNVSLFAFDYTTGAPKTGIAANIVPYLGNSTAGFVPTALSNATMVELNSANAPGWYRCALTAGETNYKEIQMTGNCNVANVAVVGRTISVLPANFSNGVIADAQAFASPTNITAGNIANITGNVVGSIQGGIAGNVAAVTGNIGGSISGNIVGSLAGSVGSVTGAVGSVTGAVGSVTGNVGGSLVGNVAGNVVGSVGSVLGAVGSVTGAVGSVTGAVGSVTGNVGGSLVGNIAGNVVGSVGSLATQAKADVTAAALTTQMTESYRANGAAPTLAQAHFELLSQLGEAAIVGTTKTINKLDHTTPAETFTLDSATAPTSITRAS